MLNDGKSSYTSSLKKSPALRPLLSKLSTFNQQCPSQTDHPQSHFHQARISNISRSVKTFINFHRHHPESPAAVSVTNLCSPPYEEYLSNDSLSRHSEPARVIRPSAYDKSRAETVLSTCVLKVAPPPSPANEPCTSRLDAHPRGITRFYATLGPIWLVKAARRPRR